MWSHSTHIPLQASEQLRETDRERVTERERERERKRKREGGWEKRVLEHSTLFCHAW